MLTFNNSDKIVFFDNICPLCNRSIDFLVRRDKSKMIRFASLQSDLANSLVKNVENFQVPEDTVIFVDEGRVYVKSQAVLKIASYLSMPYKALVIFTIIPVSWRDAIYDLVARNRQRLLPARKQCRVPDHIVLERIIG
jgi:predicted DCC family thiol-disulfide oxidoreductase YuxK